MAPVQARKKVGALFARGQKLRFDLAGAKLFVEAVEMKEMLFGSLSRVFRSAPSFDKESPIARLRDEQFARGLSKRALDLRIGRKAMPARQLGHSPGGGVKMRINPGV